MKKEELRAMVAALVLPSLHRRPISPWSGKDPFRHWAKLAVRLADEIIAAAEGQSEWE